MKPSHFTTPRSRAEGVWMLNADPVERPEPHHANLADAILIAVAIFVALAGVLWSFK